MKSILILALALSGALASAEPVPAPTPTPAPSPAPSPAPAPSPNYSVNISRLNGALQCTINSGAKSFDCTVHVAGQGALAVDMAPYQDKKGKVRGFYGVDRLTDATSSTSSSLVITAGLDKNMKSVTLVTDNKTSSSKAFTASVASSAATTLRAANINPVAIDMNDPNNLKVTLAFVMYANAQDAVIQAQDPAELSALLVDKIQPYLLSLMKN